MKIAIISDIHDNLVNLRKFLDWCKKEEIEKIICCGDVTNSETLNILANGFENKIYLVGGNIELYDEESLKQYPNIIYYGKIGKVKLDNPLTGSGQVKIGVCHEPFLINKILEKEDVDYIFYGHTHKPWIEEKNNIKIINPGTLGGVFQKATFAILENDGVNLVLVDTL